MLMLGAVGLVLLIACVNVANLLLARALRGRGVRDSRGARRQPRPACPPAAVENLLLFLAGGVLGCFVACWSLDSLVALAVAGGYVPERLIVSLDGRVFAFSLCRLARDRAGLRPGAGVAGVARRSEQRPQGRAPDRPRRIAQRPEPTPC